MTSRSLRVAAVGITPPVFKASGGIAAGIHLTERIARLCDAKMFIMAEQDSDTLEEGLRIERRAAVNVFAPLKPLIPKQLYTMGWRSQLEPWLKAWRPDIVHFHNPHPPGALAAAAQSCRKLGIPYVISTHGFVEFDEFARGMNLAPWKAPFYRFVIRRPVVQVAQQAAHVMMLSPEERPILLGMGVSEDKLSVVTNGVDPYFQRVLSREERARLTARFALPEGKPLMLYVGNHTRNKGIDVLLRATRLMKEPGVAVVSGAIRSKAEHAEMLASADVTSGDPRIVFTDFVTDEELRALYQSVSMFVFPSRADTLPLVILEAMVSGLPVISTKVGGIPYEVAPDTGVLVDPGDPAALACELDRLCADPARRAAYGAAGKDRVLKTFVWEEQAAEAVRIYHEVLKRHVQG